MYISAIPKPLCEQIARTVPLSLWDRIYVASSGSFRLEQTIGSAAPLSMIFSSDTSLYSTAIGKVAIRDPFPLTFTGKMAFAEDLLERAAFQDRCAAVMVAHEMSRFARDNEYDKKHFAHYRQQFELLLGTSAEKLTSLTSALHLTGYDVLDPQSQIQRAIADHEAGLSVGVVMFPPISRGDYEKVYRFIHENTQWQRPGFPVYDPASLGGLLEQMEEAGLPYCVISDQTWPGRRPKLEYASGRGRPYYGYYQGGRTSLRHILPRLRKPFHYTPVQADFIGPDSRVTAVPVIGQYVNFLKDVYLARGITHSTGWMNFLIYISGRRPDGTDPGPLLVGAIVYDKNKFANKNIKNSHQTICVLSDFAICQEKRFAKLIAMLSTSRELVRQMEMQTMTRLDFVFTGVFSKNPVSMKYRGVYELTGRRPAENADEGYVLRYLSDVRPKGIQEMYDDWFRQNMNIQESNKKGRRRGTSNSISPNSSSRNPETKDED